MYQWFVCNLQCHITPILPCAFPFCSFIFPLFQMILTKKQANTFNATTVTPPANNTNNSKSARSAFFNSQLYVRYDNCPIIFVTSNFVILNPVTMEPRILKPRSRFGCILEHLPVSELLLCQLKLLFRVNK